MIVTKHFCFILSTGTKIRIDSVMRPRSSSRECNTSALVTVYSYSYSNEYCELKMLLLSPYHSNNHINVSLARLVSCL